MNKLLLALTLGLLCISCGGETTTDSGHLTYGELDTMSYELDVEIGDREGYIQGRIQNIILADDGSIIVADWDNVSLEHYDSEGNHIGTIATEGNGPGEIPTGFSITDFGRGIYFVRAGGSRRAYLTRTSNGGFEFGETFLAPPVPGRGRFLYFARNDSQYYGLISPPSADEDLDYTFRHVMVSDPTGQEIFVDSLQMVRSPRGVAIQIQGGTVFLGGGFESEQIVNPGKGDGSYIISRPYERVFELYNNDFELEKRIEVDFVSGDYTEAEIDTIVSRTLPSGDTFPISQSARTDFRNRIVEYGRPGFHGLWPSESNYLLLVEEGEEENQYVVLDSDGNPEGTFALSTMDTVYYFRGGKVYTTREDPARGFFVRVYNLDN